MATQLCWQQHRRCRQFTWQYDRGGWIATAVMAVMAVMALMVLAMLVTLCALPAASSALPQVVEQPGLQT